MMILLCPERAATLRDWLVPDRPGPLVGLHVLETGNGTCFADRWPHPRAALWETAGNYALVGDPAALTPDDLRSRVGGFVDAPKTFAPLLRAACPTTAVWARVIQEQPDADPAAHLLAHPPHGATVRRLKPADAFHVWGLSPDLTWIAKTWGGAPGLAASSRAWGAFVDGRLAAVACSFYVGARYEDVGVATEPERRGLGLSVACAGALCNDIRGRGRLPSWTTSPDNWASLRVAEKLGFRLHRRDILYAVDIPIPPSARRAPGEQGVTPECG